MTDPVAYTRRRFLSDGLCLISAAATAPAFLSSSAHAILGPDRSLSSRPGIPDDRILVIIQLGGGNDGLNTVVPFGDAAYYRARPSLAVRENDVIRLGGGRHEAGLGLHPSLAGIKQLYDDGKVGLIQGVGYPNPNRSHFKSMDIWQTADTSGSGDGWLGRYFDNTCDGEPDPEASISLGRETPLALQGTRSRPVSFESADFFRWAGKELHESLEKPYEAFNRAGKRDDVEGDSNLGFLMRTSLDAQVSSDRIRAAVRRKTETEFPRTPLGRDLKMVAQMIAANLDTRVYYVNHGGFDTHAGQAGTHARLLQVLGDAVLAFQRELQRQDNAGRVLTMTFSEFGRRVGQNASGGTDHGTAAPMFVIGDPARAGVLGQAPSLTELDSGDLIYTLDFRCVYAGILADWFKVEPATVLGKRYREAQIIENA
jgi:uncharacterized protein (DUF1501 family)